MPTNDHDLNQPAAARPRTCVIAEHPGYEVTDVNVNGIAGLSRRAVWFRVVFFFLLCYGLGMLINGGLKKEDGPSTKWNRAQHLCAAPTDGKRQDLASNPEMQQKELQQMTSTFPQPRLDIDDGNQATADLHAREDLLLNNYSVARGQGGTIRIPIERAMELIAQRGLAGRARRRQLQPVVDGGRCEACGSGAADHWLCAHRI